MKNTNISEMASHKQSEIWDSGGGGVVIICIYGASLVFKAIFFIHSVYVPQNGRYLKTAGHGVKGNEIWDSGIVVVCIWGTFDILVFKVALGSLCVLVSKWTLTRKRLAIGQSGVKFGTRG